LQIFIDISGIQRHASVDADRFGAALKDHGDFVGRAHDRHAATRVLHPLEEFSLGVGVTAVDLVENDAGLAGLRVLG